MRQSYTFSNYLLICMMHISVLLILPDAAYALNLKQVEQIALDNDPIVNSHEATSRSFSEMALFSATLPDPKLILGAVNMPVDTFDLSQEAMTQLKVGIQQEFPQGDLLNLTQKQAEWMSRSSLAQAEDTKRKVLSNARQTYLNLYYEVSALNILTETTKLFSKLVSITESHYASGRVNQQDVIQANLELLRLGDRAVKIQGREEGYRVELAQWVGELAWQDIDGNFPEMSDIQTNIDINAAITRHPLVQAQTLKVNATRTNIDIAKQDYKPRWSASLDYGFRSGDNLDGSSRSDFATALVSFNLPVFTSNRQDKNVIASQEKANAAQYQKDDTLRQLKRTYEKDLHLWKRLGEREKLYRNSLLLSARNNTQASLNAYQSGVTEFNTLMRAQITELDIHLEDLRVRVDRAITAARLLYITGDTKP